MEPTITLTLTHPELAFAYNAIKNSTISAKDAQFVLDFLKKLEEIALDADKVQKGE
jgi:hypothetical protein